MPSTLPIDINTTYESDAPAATGRISTAKLDADHREIERWLNEELVPALARIIRDDDTLVDEIVRLRNLHPEVVEALEGLTVLEAADVCAPANVALSGLQTINGYTTIAGDRVLCIAQTNPLQNGPWVAAVGAWVRPSDFTSGSVTVARSVIDILNGDLSGSTWLLSASVTVDSGSQPWVQISGIGTVVPIVRGGTGATSAAAARLALGISAAMDPVVTAADLAAGRLAFGGLIPSVATIAALKALTATSMTGYVQVAGYLTAGDGGGGLFRWVAADATTDNAGTVIAPTAGGGRFRRVYAGSLFVRWFAAVGDGVTDDTAAIAATIAAAAVAGGGCVFFPAGTYKTSATIDITASGVRLLGESGATIAAAFSSGQVLRFLGTLASPIIGVGVERLRVTRTAVETADMYGIRFQFCTGAHCLNCEVIGGTTATFSGGLPAAVDRLGFLQGIEGRACKDLRIEANLIQNVRGNGISLDVVNNSADPCAGNIVTGNTITDIGDCGIGVHNSVRDAVVSCNTIVRPSRNAGCGIDIAGCTRCLFQGNTIVDAQIGIRCLKNISYVSLHNHVVGNIVRGLKSRDAADMYGLQLFDAYTNTFIGNVFEGLKGGAATTHGFYPAATANTVGAADFIDGIAYTQGKGYILKNNIFRNYDVGMRADNVGGGVNVTLFMDDNEFRTCGTGISLISGTTEERYTVYGRGNRIEGCTIQVTAGCEELKHILRFNWQETMSQVAPVEWDATALESSTTGYLTRCLDTTYVAGGTFLGRAGQIIGIAARMDEVGSGNGSFQIRKSDNTVVLDYVAADATPTNKRIFLVLPADDTYSFGLVKTTASTGYVYLRRIAFFKH